MGTIVNTFINIELSCTDPVKDMGMVRACAEDAGMSENQWAMHVGNNFSLFITVFPTGSKVGWETSKMHNLQVKDFLESLEEEFEFISVVKSTTTEG